MPLRGVAWDEARCVEMPRRVSLHHLYSTLGPTALVTLCSCYAAVTLQRAKLDTRRSPDWGCLDLDIDHITVQ